MDCLRHSPTNWDSFLKWNMLPGQGSSCSLKTELLGNATDASSGSRHPCCMEGFTARAFEAAYPRSWPVGNFGCSWWGETNWSRWKHNGWIWWSWCFSFTRYCHLFPVLLWLECVMLRLWPYFQNVGLRYFLSFHWFLPCFEALLFTLAQLLVCPKECVEFLFWGMSLS